MPIAENAKSIAFKPLPEAPEGLAADAVTLVLFYQYMEPVWTKKQHRGAMKAITDLAASHDIKGRGRCAPEGLNCTLTGSAAGVRGFCQGLRAWDPKFNETDFKFTDGLARAHGFKSFGLRKVDELVGYGLAGDKAPALETKDSVHLEALDYHAMMTDPEAHKDTVIVDVRNAYESAIGHFAPPPGGALLIDPKMRNSHDFPGWLNLPETQEKLNGKKVMMYCTGGIRCERASALLGEVAAATPGFEPQQIVELRGGIERYIKTFPEGGAWAGKNYLFDRRRAQVPAAKSEELLEADKVSGLVRAAKCVGCKKPWDEYRGKAKCSGKDLFHGNGLGMECGVPVVLCPNCEPACKAPLCELCAEGHEAPRVKPDFAKLKAAQAEAAQRKAQEGARAKAAEAAGEAGETQGQSKRKAAGEGEKKGEKKAKKAAGNSGAARVFLGKLPLVVEARAIRQLLARAAGQQERPGGEEEGECVEAVHFLTDKATGAFYGSCFVQMKSAAAAAAAVEGLAALKKEKAQGGGKAAGGSPSCVLLDVRKVRCGLAPPKEGEVWPPEGGFVHRERPPVM